MKTETVVVELNPFDRRRLEDLAGYYMTLTPGCTERTPPAQILLLALMGHHRTLIQCEPRSRGVDAASVDEHTALEAAGQRTLW